MSNTNWRSFLRALPKCEHHMHVEGALTPQLLFQLAVKNNVSLPKDDPAYASVEALSERYSRFTSLDDFLAYYYIGMSVLVTEDDFAALAWDYFEHAKADGAAHAELSFDPQAHLSRRVAYETIISGLQKAQKRASTELDISSELICCFLRHLPVKDCEETFESPAIQASISRGQIAGIGLDSSEMGFPPENFAALYARAAQLDLRRTAHAGEEGPSTYITNALDTLNVQRIDHGIRAADDEVLLKRLVSQRTLLTVCPLSNVLLRAAPSVSALPIRRFLEAGIQFSINSDDPAYFGGHYILDNYCAVQDAFDLSVDEWKGVVEAGIRGSWCDDKRKHELLRRLSDVVGEWRAAGRLSL